MKMLQSEVLIVPGRSAQYPQGANITEGQPVPGGAVVRLTNTTTRENAFKVRVRCDNPYWQEDWVHPIALPPPANPDNTVSGKPDQRGPQGRWVKVYVPRDGSRDILLRFQVPQTPDARAGRYPFVVEIETQIIGAGEQITRRNRVMELTGTAYIAPFYKWSVDLTPSQQSVGLFRHSDEFAVVVTNEGNDWLYCDLEVPRPTNMLLEAPTLRLALPPPEPGELLPTGVGEPERIGIQRSVPLRATSQLRTLGGLPTLQPIALTALRVDAPSVILPTGNARNGSIVAQETAEQEQVPGNRGLMYRPPVPATLSMLFDRTGNAFQAVIALVVGLAVLTLAVLVGEENIRFNGMKAEPLESDVRTMPGKPLRFRGPKLEGAKITLGGIVVMPKTDYSGINTYSLTVPKALDGKTVALKAQRSLRYLPFLDTFLPSYESKTEIKVNVPSEKPEKETKGAPNGAADIAQAGQEQSTKEKEAQEKEAKDKLAQAAKNTTTAATAGAQAGQKPQTAKQQVKIKIPAKPAGPVALPDSGAPAGTLLKLFNSVIHAPSREARNLADTVIAAAAHRTPKDAPQNAMAYAVQGYLLVQIGQTIKGQEALQNSLELQPDNFLAHAGLGLLAYQQAMQVQGVARTEKLKAAVGQLQTAIGNYSYAALPHYLLGRAYLQFDLNDKALQQVQAAIDGEDPKMAAAYQLQGEIYARMGNTPQAQTAFENAQKLDPDLPNLAEDINQLHGK